MSKHFRVMSHELGVMSEDIFAHISYLISHSSRLKGASSC